VEQLRALHPTISFSPLFDSGELERGEPVFEVTTRNQHFQCESLGFHELKCFNGGGVELIPRVERLELLERFELCNVLNVLNDLNLLNCLNDRGRREKCKQSPFSYRMLRTRPRAIWKFSQP